MPWSVADVDRHHKGLTDVQKRLWVNVANDMLKRCQKRRNVSAGYCEGVAIRVANATVNKGREG